MLGGGDAMKPTQVHLSIRDINLAARSLYTKMARQLDIDTGAPDTERRWIKIWPVPRGGIPVAFVLQGSGHCCEIVSTPEEADFIVDDLVDSGATRLRFNNKPFAALFSKGALKNCAPFVAGWMAEENQWLVFPWEGSALGSAEDIVTRFLQFIGEDPQRGGLIETPKRVIKAWSEEWFSGYKRDPSEVLKSFKDGGERYDEMIIVKGIPVYTHCEHHLAPFFGEAVVAYVPNGHIVGLSKLARLTDIFARRLQVQERLNTQIADAVMDHLKAKGCGVILKCRHLCMESRGIRAPGTETITSVVRGVMFDNPAARAELLALIRS
jgi:GTP cyclohydrolase I